MDASLKALELDLLKSQAVSECSWHIVSIHWFFKWIKYLHNDDEDPPGPVNNSLLFDENEVVDYGNLVEGIDYVPLSEKLWQCVSKHYSHYPFPSKTTMLNRPCTLPVGDNLLFDVKVECNPIFLHINSGIIRSGRNDKKKVRKKHRKSKGSKSDDIIKISPMDSLGYVLRLLHTKSILFTHDNFICIANHSNDDKCIISTKGSLLQNRIGALCFKDIIVREPTQDELKNLISEEPLLPTVISSVLPSEQGLCGMTNMSNTCYLNACLQCLGHLMPLVNYFSSLQWRNDINRHNTFGYKGDLARIFSKFLTTLWSGAYKLIEPSDIKYYMSRLSSQFSGNGQHDCQESLGFLLDGLHEDLNRIQIKPYRTLSGSQGRPCEEVAQETIEYIKSRDDSIITDLFRGILKSSLTCTDCGHQSITFDPFNSLSLSLPSKKTDLFNTPSQERPMEKTIYFILAPNQNGSSNHSSLSTVQTVTLYIRFPLTAIIQHVLDALATRHDISSSEIVFMEIIGSKIRRQLLPHDSVSKLLSNNTFCAYHLPEISMFVSESYKLCFVSQRWNSQFNGIPLVLPVPNTKFSPHFLIKSLLQRFVAISPCLQPYTEKIEDFYAETMELDAIENFCNENELTPINGNSLDHHDSSNVTLSHLLQITFMDGDNRVPLVLHPVMLNGKAYSEDEDNLIDGNLINKPNLCVDWCYKILNNLDPSAFSKLSFNGHIPRKKAEPLFVISKEPSPSLDDCLKAFTQPEFLSDNNMCYCSQCKKLKPGRKEISLWSLPDLLIFHLKRFSQIGTYLKSNAQTIYYPIEKLEMSEWLKESPERTTKSHLYDLVAVSDHFGNLGYGHYTATIKHAPSGKWFTFDDDVWFPCKDPIAKIPGQAYLLIYERRQS